MNHLLWPRMREFPVDNSEDLIIVIDDYIPKSEVSVDEREWAMITGGNSCSKLLQSGKESEY